MNVCVFFEYNVLLVFMCDESIFSFFSTTFMELKLLVMSSDTPVESLEAMLRRLRALPPIDVPSFTSPLSGLREATSSSPASAKSVSEHTDDTETEAETETDATASQSQVPTSSYAASTRTNSTARRAPVTPRRGTPSRQQITPRIPVSCDPRYSQMCGRYFPLSEDALNIAKEEEEDTRRVSSTPRCLTPKRAVTPTRPQMSARPTTPRRVNESNDAKEDEIRRLQAEVRSMYTSLMRREQDVRCRELAVARREEEAARVERRLVEAEKDRRHWEHTYKVGLERTSRARDGVALRLKQHYEEKIQQVEHRERQLADESAALYSCIASEETRLMSMAQSMGVHPSVDLSSIHSRNSDTFQSPKSPSWRR